MTDWLTIIFYFAKDLQNYQICELMPHITSKTLNKCISTIRQTLSDKWTEKLETLRFTNVEMGIKNIIQIDESIFGKKSKNNRGKKFHKDWVFGMIDTTTRMIVLQMVATRDTGTLLPLIQKHVDTGCHIAHDGWGVYMNLQNHGYQHHSTVIHTREFVAQDGTHTNG